MARGEIKNLYVRSSLEEYMVARVVVVSGFSPRLRFFRHKMGPCSLLLVQGVR
jgi:hypothetical protein